MLIPQPADVVTGHTLSPFPSPLGKVEAEWALDVLVDASKELGAWAPIATDRFDALVVAKRKKLRGDPFYNPHVGLTWLRKHGYIHVVGGLWLLMTTTLLRILAGHPWTAHRLMQRQAHEAGCARVPNPVSMDTVLELYAREEQQDGPS